MSKVFDLIEYLKTLPPDTTVEVLERYSYGFETDTRWKLLELEPLSDTCFTADGVLYLGED